MTLSLLISLPDDPTSIEFVASELRWDEEKALRAHDLYAQRLPPLVDRAALPYLLGVRPKFIASMGRNAPRYYRTFQAPKALRGARLIEAPRRALKVIQRWLYDHVLLNVEFPTCVTGFVRERNIFVNALPHVPGKNLMVLDISDFFHSVNQSRVQQIFQDIGFPPEVGDQLASLCCLDGRLPQGAPTSPALANIAFQPADRELEDLAKSWNCTYSRYADDLAFSGERRFGREDGDAIQNILGSHGFAVNHAKSRRVGAGGRQVIAGIVVNETAQPPRWKRRLWRATFHRASRHPQEFAGRAAVLRGIAAFINQYDRPLAARYRAIADAIGTLPGGSGV